MKQSKSTSDLAVFSFRDVGTPAAECLISLWPSQLPVSNHGQDDRAVGQPRLSIVNPSGSFSRIDATAGQTTLRRRSPRRRWWPDHRRIAIADGPSRWTVQSSSREETRRPPSRCRVERQARISVPFTQQNLRHVLL
jgi:hypothetical protein